MSSDLQSRFLTIKRRALDATKSARARRTTFLVILLSAFLVSICLSDSLRAYTAKHPGLILVLVGVVGEVYFDWKEEKGPNAKWKRLFMALLVFGLVYELYEAADADKEAAFAAKKAADAQLLANNIATTNAELTLRIEELKRDNLILEAQIQPRRIKPLQSISIQKDLADASKCKIELDVSAVDAEAKMFALQIKNVLSRCGYTAFISAGVEVPMDMKEVPTGICFAVTNIDITLMAPEEMAVLQAFRKAGLRPNCILRNFRDEHSFFRIDVEAKPVE
jgi:hypothetical protein